MKRLLLLLLLAVGMTFISCSENSASDSNGTNETPSQLEELQKRFDFSEVNTERLEIKNVYEVQDNENIDTSHTFVSTHPDLAVVVGEIDKCLWLGLFNRESGKMQYQYTDIEHPISYSAYGVEYEYGVGNVCGIHFEDNNTIIAIQYPKQESKEALLDIIAFDENSKARRTSIIDNSYYDNYPIQTIAQWSDNTVYFRIYADFTLYDYIIYDKIKREPLCCIREQMFPLFWLFELKSWTYPNPFPYSFGGNAHAFISAMNPLHIWVTAFNDGIVHITDIQCTYSTTITTEREIELFEPYTGDFSKSPCYSVEYQTRTDDYISAIVTQTEYDGTIAKKTVNVRLENDELKVDIQ